MEQEPGQDPEHDGPDGSQPPPDSSHAGEAGSPGPDAPSSGASGADADAGAGGAEGESVFGPWEGLEGTLGAAREREELLAGFARGGVWDKHPPGPELAAAVAKAAGPEWRCGVATGEELVGLLRAMAALQSWAGAGLLGVIRALVRDDDPAFLGRSRHGDLPDEWDESLVREIALALAVSAPSAGKTTRAAWELGARLPGVELLLRDGTLDLPRARLVAEVFEDLSDEDAARAEGLLLPRLTEPPRKTYTQIEGIAAAIAAEVDPGLAERRRKAAERHRSRVLMFRERSGTAALCGRDLPADQTLAAFARVNARARAYKESGAFPEEGMDRLRATAYLDILNHIAAEDRIAYGRLSPWPGAGDPGSAPPAPRSPFPPPAGGPPPTPSDLALPLATLLGLAERPGEGHGLGTLDPALCRALAATAARSPHTSLCVTVTDPDGIAIGHGCAAPGRLARPPAGPPPPLAALPARINLTITTARLAELRARPQTGPPGPPGQRETGWALARRGAGPPADPDWCGPWALTLPSGQEHALTLEPVPTFACDHRHESHAYQPNATLRHLVQIRDHTCTFPPCSRHARDSDFEHAVPYDHGGRTCACNAGARSRKCHRIKQAPGWNVTQPQPGWHQWTTPRGRTYTQGPKRYPV
jgi:hypothetical protein